MNQSYIVRSLLTWFAQNARPLPWRRTRDPYAIWVSEIMLQQTQVKTVLPYWERWMRALPDLAALAKAKPQTLHKLWEGLGYYTRVRNMHRAAQLIMARHEGRFPHDFEEVLALPGIGRYTAGAICSIAFNQPKPILDGNVMRVLTRWQGIGGDPRERSVNALLWQLAEELVQQAARHAPRTTPHAPVLSSMSRSWNSERSSVRHGNHSATCVRLRSDAWPTGKTVLMNCPASAGASARRRAASWLSSRKEAAAFLSEKDRSAW
jgi:A/G-specific adenine glycosylase